jgi:hypothetical protein
MVKLCCHANRGQCPNFNFNEIVHMFGEESFLEALKIDIGAFKDYQVTVVPTQLQAKDTGAARGKRNLVPAGITGHFERMAEMDDTAGSVWLRRCPWRGIGFRRRDETALGSGNVCTPRAECCMMPRHRIASDRSSISPSASAATLGGRLGVQSGRRRRTCLRDVPLRGSSRGRPRGPAGHLTGDSVLPFGGGLGASGRDHRAGGYVCDRP